MSGKLAMNLFADLQETVRSDEPLAPHTWFRLGGPARYFAEPRDKAELLELIRRCRENEIKIWVLGRGSNLLVADAGVEGMVIHLTDRYFGEIQIEKDGRVKAQAGTSLSRLIQVAARAGLSGMECLVGIPGSVGGSVRINAGGRFGDIGNVAQGVSLIDSSGYEFERKRDDIYFGYRMTNIMAKFIMEAEFQLVPDDPERIAKMIKEIWLLKKNSQPEDSRNAGCIFKNPRALSAGALIDKAGLKGSTIGGAKVSERHANFIVATDDCTATDVMQLIELIRTRVRDRFEVELETEVDIWQ